jgi:branched-subunit amino acid ABC-type transport system permease component
MRQFWLRMACRPEELRIANRRFSAWRYLLLSWLLLLLTACSSIDSDQVRLCRIVLPALHPDGAQLAVRSVEPGRPTNSVIITYKRDDTFAHVVTCRFGGGRLSGNRQTLVGLEADGETFGEVRLLILRRFWMDEPSTALAAPPLSVEETAHLPKLDRGFAVGLQHVLSALPQIAIYALLAPAYALIYGLIGRINLAFGELAIVGGQAALIGAVAGGMAWTGSPMAVLLGSLALALAAAATHGELMARAVFVPLMGRSGQSVLVASVGLAIGMMEYVRLAQGESIRWTPPLLNTPVAVAWANTFVVTMTEGALATVLVCLAATSALVIIMRRSAFGRRWRATAEEPQAAALFGIDPHRILIQSFAIASLLAGLGGFVMTSHYGGIGFSGGLAIGLKALIGAIAGGIGSVPGAILGAMVIGSFEALWSAFFPLEHADIAVYSLLALLLVFRPGGLLGWADGLPRRV